MPVSNVQLNIGYFFQVPGFLKPLQFILHLVTIICMLFAGGGFGASGFVWFTLAASLVTTLGMTVLLALDVADMINQRISWCFIEMGHNIVWTVAYFISIWISVGGSTVSYTNTAALLFTAVFCLVLFLAHGCDFLAFFKQWRQDNNAPTLPPPVMPGSAPVSGDMGGPQNPASYNYT